MHFYEFYTDIHNSLGVILPIDANKTWIFNKNILNNVDCFNCHRKDAATFLCQLPHTLLKFFSSPSTIHLVFPIMQSLSEDLLLGYPDSIE